MRKNIRHERYFRLRFSDERAFGLSRRSENYRRPRRKRTYFRRRSYENVYFLLHFGSAVRHRKRGHRNVRLGKNGARDFSVAYIVGDYHGADFQILSSEKAYKLPRCPARFRYPEPQRRKIGERFIRLRVFFRYLARRRRRVYLRVLSRCGRVSEFQSALSSRFSDERDNKKRRRFKRFLLRAYRMHKGVQDAVIVPFIDL